MQFTERYQTGLYQAQVPDWHASDSVWKAGKVLEIIKANAPQVRSICDVGCGAGGVLANLQAGLDESVRLTGYDVAGEAIARCRPKENKNLRFHHGDFLVDDRQHYDLILALDVFEHVPDYLGFLSRLSRRADNFVFHIPLDISATTVLRRSKYMMHMREVYGHLHYFTAETAIATLMDCGYRIVEKRYTWDREMRLFSRPPKGVWPRLRHWIHSSLLLAQKVTTAPAFWSRLREQYNLLVFARPHLPGP